MDFHRGQIMKRIAVEILAIRLLIGLASATVFLPLEAAAGTFGYANITLQPGLNLIGVPLRTRSNTFASSACQSHEIAAEPLAAGDSGLLRAVITEPVARSARARTLA